MNELSKLEQKYKELGDEIKKLKEKEEAEKLPWHGLKEGDAYWFIDISRDEATVYEDEYTKYDIVDVHEVVLNSGFSFLTEKEAQRKADMINYEALLSCKARKMGGLLGYGQDEVEEDACILVFMNNDDGFSCIPCDPYDPYTDYCILEPILTYGCAKTLAEDSEIIDLAKKIRGKK